MDDFRIQTGEQGSRRSWIMPLLLLIVGVLIGVIVSSDLGWLPTGHAVPEPPSGSCSCRQTGYHCGSALIARCGRAEFRRCCQGRQACGRQYFCDAEWIE